MSIIIISNDSKSEYGINGSYSDNEETVEFSPASPSYPPTSPSSYYSPFPSPQSPCSPRSSSPTKASRKKRRIVIKMAVKKAREDIGRKQHPDREPPTRAQSATTPLKYGRPSKSEFDAIEVEGHDGTCCIILSKVVGGGPIFGAPGPEDIRCTECEDWGTYIWSADRKAYLVDSSPPPHGIGYEDERCNNDDWNNSCC